MMPHRPHLHLSQNMLKYDTIRLMHIAQWPSSGHPTVPHSPQSEIMYPSKQYTNNWTIPCPTITSEHDYYPEEEEETARSITSGGSGKLTMQDCDYTSMSQQWMLSPGATFNNSAITSILNMGSGNGSNDQHTRKHQLGNCPKGDPLSIPGCSGSRVVASPTYGRLPSTMSFL